MMRQENVYILGISAYYHDSAACILHNGIIKVAIQEERLSRIKHDDSFPSLAIDACLEYMTLDLSDVSAVVYYEKPFLKFERIITTLRRHAPRGMSYFIRSMKSWMKKKIWIRDNIKKELDYQGQILFAGHHESHAAGAFFDSPFEKSAIIVFDGVGESSTISIGVGEKNRVRIIKEQYFPHSLGLLYSSFTQYCGFKVNSGEYKLMGLAAYGSPKYADIIREHLVDISEKGDLILNMSYFNYEVGDEMINPKFEKLFGKNKRKPETTIEQFYKDIASSIQLVLEDAILKIAAYAKELTNTSTLCLSGGVALNCRANQRLLEEGIFDDIWIQAAAGDSGGAVGAAYIGYHHHYGLDRNKNACDLKNRIYLGNDNSNASIKSVLDEYGIQYEKLEDGILAKKCAALLNEKQVLGWFRGRMEFGPRALGSRSILASPRFEDMQRYVNLKIKKREQFRPFAPIVTEEDSAEWFDINRSYPYMLFTVRSKHTKQIPSCIHVDGTSRVQTLSQNDNPELHNVLLEMKRLTGIPILINTSFNLRGEPIVATPIHALTCFFNCDMDYLILENFIISKQANLTVPQDLPQSESYELD